ncbi:MAG: hypothetical protein SynsKO_42890 [Synoicihabitans sp.]
MSPYENRLHAESFRRIGLISLVRPGQVETLKAVSSTPDAAAIANWKIKGLNNVSLHLQETATETWLFLFAEFDGKDVYAAAENVHNDAWFQRYAGMLEAHPRAQADNDWMPMELINVIGPTLSADQGPGPLERCGYVVQLDPEKELTYRTLHQTNWPGVVDQMARSHRRYWVTFLIEFGEKLLLFTYSEYVGIDHQADDEAMAADPVTQRWWQHTQPCLISVTPENEAWTEMLPILDRTGEVSKIG